MAFQRIPPIHCLQSFEALARLRSVSAAADELGVTPSAVSHRLRQLETLLARRLFDRNGFTPTAEGAAYLAQVRPALRSLAQLPGLPAAVPPRTTLRVAVTPTFSRQILLPHLAHFRRSYPEIDLVLQVAIPLRHATAEVADLEVRFGPGDYRDVISRRLLSDEIFPVCSPDYLREAGPFGDFDRPEAFERARLIRSPLEPWRHWFDACGIDRPEPSEGAQFNDLGLLFDAAVAGFGVALARSRLGHDWLDSGRLVRLSSRAVPSPYHHQLCWRQGALDRWECAAFADWLGSALNMPI